MVDRLRIDDPIVVPEQSTVDLRIPELGVYARGNVPAYWIVDLVEQQVEVYTDPTGPDPAPTYRTRRIDRPGDPVPFVVDGREPGPIPAQERLP